MAQKELSKNLIDRLATLSGHLAGIGKMIDKGEDPVKIFTQMKAVENGLQKAIYLLLDDVFRKALAEKIVSSKEKCPGNCGYEDYIDQLFRQFPGINPEEVPSKLKEIQAIECHLKTILEND